jgi:hypothetical protein
MTREQNNTLRTLKAIEKKAWIAMQIASKQGKEREAYPAWSAASDAVRCFHAAHGERQ